MTTPTQSDGRLDPPADSAAGNGAQHGAGAQSATITSRGRARRTTLGAIVRYCAAGLVALAVLVTILIPILPVQGPNDQDLVQVLAGPNGTHWLGTDELGRDLFSRILWGVHTSLIAAVIATGVAVVIGLPFGVVAGYLGGWFDFLASRVADSVLTVPALILLLAAQTALNTGIEGQMVVLGLVFAPRIFRIVRTETLRVAGAPFVHAGRMAGAGPARIGMRYLFPAVRAQLFVQASYLLGLSLTVEAGISFLGIGVKPPQASLGSLLVGASSLLGNKPHVILIPALILTLLILSCNVLGDEKEEAA